MVDTDSNTLRAEILQTAYLDCRLINVFISFVVITLGKICKVLRYVINNRFYGVMVSTLDSESSDPSSNLGRTCKNSITFYNNIFLITCNMDLIKSIEEMKQLQRSID